MENEAKLNLVSKTIIVDNRRQAKSASQIIAEITGKYGDLIVNKTIKNNQSLVNDMLMKQNDNAIKSTFVSKVNVEIFKEYFKDERFTNANLENIELICNEDLPYDSLLDRFSIYEQKKNLKDTSKMTYQEIMLLAYDKDEEAYKKDFEKFVAILENTHNLYLWGNAGNGKTTFANNIAKKMDLKLYTINSVKNEYSLKGYFDDNNVYHLSNYELWYRDGGVLLLDECDSYNANGMLYLNNGVEVNSKSLTLEDGSVITKNPKCYVIACANTDGMGKTQEYIGRNALDKAFMNRFIRIEFKEYPYIHKQIIGDEVAYNKIKEYYEEMEEEITCRNCVKIKQLSNAFSINDIVRMLKKKEIEL